MTPSDGLAKEKELRQVRYAQRLVSDKDKWMGDFKLRTRLYGREWAETIWNLCKEIARGER